MPDYKAFQSNFNREEEKYWQVYFFLGMRQIIFVYHFLPMKRKQKKRKCSKHIRNSFDFFLAIP